jgi:hypothetical protein
MMELCEEYGYPPQFYLATILNVKYCIERIDSTRSNINKTWTLETFNFMGPSTLLSLLSYLITDMMESIKDELELSTFLDTDVWEKSVPVIENFKGSIPEIANKVLSAEPPWLNEIREISSFVVTIAMEDC